MRVLKAKVSGKVQGVWFRKYTLDSARDLAFVGMVKNLIDVRLRKGRALPWYSESTASPAPVCSNRLSIVSRTPSSDVTCL